MDSDEKVSFDWDPDKDRLNQKKHGVSFDSAQHAALDPDWIILEDISHNTNKEKRYYCLGKFSGGILTVRFTYRGKIIWIIRAGYCWTGKQIYKKQNCIWRWTNGRSKSNWRFSTFPW